MKPRHLIPSRSREVTSEQKMAEDLFQQWLKREIPILADGAMGTMLHAKGLSMETCFDEYNLTQPALIAEIHREYIDAGAELIETNTFGANRFKLAAHGLENSVSEINSAAVELARRVIDASFKDVLLAGSVGPLGVHLAPFGRVQPEQAYKVFHEQIEALITASVDVIIIETHNDLKEVRQAVRAAKDLSEIPVIATVTFTRDDRTLLGDNPTRVARQLVESGADIIGANCSSGPAQLLRILRQMRQAEPEARFCVMPNAGWPERVSGRIMYPATADYFGEYARVFCEAGASIIGGCCGTTPEHIAAMRTNLDSMEAPCIESPSSDDVLGGQVSTTATREPTELASKLEANSFVISVEMDPPRGFSTHKLLAGASLLAEAGADVINVADSPMARMRMSPWAVCSLIQREVGIDSVLHFPTRGRNLLRVQGDLLAAHALDVRNIFVVLGDPTSIGDYPDAMDDYDLVPSGLIKLIKQGLNAGVDHAGADIGEATSFFVGCALNLCAKDPEREMHVLRKKIDNGADFALTQPVYEPELAENFITAYEARYGPLELSVLVGVLPLYGTRHAAFLHNEVPGIQIPKPIREQIAAAGDRAPQEGVRIAVELLHSLSSIVQGVYLMPPFHRYDLAAEIIEAIRQSE
jgi:methionine synthase I (cobalamin-dependent)/5,10-methylenetetrahydrofolate reductase